MNSLPPYREYGKIRCLTERVGWLVGTTDTGCGVGVAVGRAVIIEGLMVGAAGKGGFDGVEVAEVGVFVGYKVVSIGAVVVGGTVVDEGVKLGFREVGCDDGASEAGKIGPRVGEFVVGVGASDGSTAIRLGVDVWRLLGDCRNE